MDYKRITIKTSKGFTLIEMIAAMVLVAILVPGVSSILGGTLMNIALTNLAILSNMEADHAQRKFMKHINGANSFSSTVGDQAVDKLTFTSYLGGLEYQYIIDDASRTIKYSRDGGTAGLLLQNVVVDTTINEERYTSRFAFKGVKGNELVTSPALSDSIHGVELTFYLLRGESFYSYTTYAAIDENHLNRSSVNSAQE
jgi:prepilin-type N-terminal cleavage/methylation domain-containing protein